MHGRTVNVSSTTFLSSTERRSWSNATTSASLCSNKRQPGSIGCSQRNSVNQYGNKGDYLAPQEAGSHAERYQGSFPTSSIAAPSMEALNRIADGDVQCPIRFCQARICCTLHCFRHSRHVKKIRRIEGGPSSGLIPHGNIYLLHWH